MNLGPAWRSVADRPPLSGTEILLYNPDETRVHDVRTVGPSGIVDDEGNLATGLGSWWWRPLPPQMDEIRSWWAERIAGVPFDKIDLGGLLTLLELSGAPINRVRLVQTGLLFSRWLRVSSRTDVEIQWAVQIASWGVKKDGKWGNRAFAIAIPDLKP